MDFSNIRVLLADGAARQTLTILHGLKEIGCHVTVLCSHRLDVCYASRLPDEKILHKDAECMSEGYIPFVLSLVSSGRYDVLIPVGEMTTNKITANEELFGRYVRIACAERKAYLRAFDKQQTFEIAIDSGMPCPRTRRLGQSVEAYLETVEFPLIIKPRNGVGSIGFHKFEKREDFWPYIREKNIDLDDYVLQEFVHYDRRLGAVLFIDRGGRMCTAYADEILRWYPIDAGTATTIRSVDEPELLRHSHDLLKAMEWQGVAALSFMVDKKDGLPKLCEINGRIPASIKLSWVCGFNIARQLIELACGEEVTQYPMNTRFGLLTRHSQAELAWFVHAKDRFTCRPSWFSWKNTSDVVYWKGDPKPYLTYTVQQLLGYGRAMKKRRH